jgi:hypothetical protein
LSQKEKPQAVYACLGFGGVVATRLLTGQQGGVGGRGCCPVGQCAFDYDFLLGKQLHLGMRRSARLPAGGDRANFAPQYFPSRAPLVPYWRDYNSHGEGSVGKDLKRLCSFCSSASLGDRVARIVGSLFLSQNLSVTALMSRAARGAGQCFRFPSRQAYRRLTSCRTRDRRRRRSCYLYAVWRERPHQCPL